MRLLKSLCALTGVLVACLLVSGCGKPKKHTVGWLKVTVDTAYKGQRVHLVGYSECIGTRVPGGSFGATPTLGTIVMHRQSFGQTMPDGSFIAVRTPVLCWEYFGKGSGVAPWPLEPMAFVPLVVWSDRQHQPTLMEAYMAEEAYAGQFSRLALPSAIVEPLTSVPSEVEEAFESQRNVIVQDTGTSSDRGGRNNVKAAFGWPKAHSNYPYAKECQNLFRTGLLVPGRNVRSRQSYEQCRYWLASVVPFIWDGKQYNGDPKRSGMMVFQQTTKEMRNAPYYVGQELVKLPGPEHYRGSESYDISHVLAPVRDPDDGYGEMR